MKFAPLLLLVVGFVACSSAAPVVLDSLPQREDRFNTIAREYVSLEARTGFANVNNHIRNHVHDTLPGLVEGGTMAQLAKPSHQAKTLDNTHLVHFDRQQPTNAHGFHKAAIQLNGGNPSTIAQVRIHKSQIPSPNKLARALKYSMKRGHEVGLYSKKKAANIRQQQQRQAAKKDRHAAAHRAGMARAKNGVFRKGRK